MLDFDHSNFIRFIEEFPEQVKESDELVKKVDIPISRSDLQHLVISGMGGSAIAGDLLLAYVQDELNVPGVVNREYQLPAFVNEHSLVIAISYSGNTEETLSSVEQALHKNARVVGIASGGELENICKKNQLPFIKVPGGYPPRQALGFLFFSVLNVLEKIQLIEFKKADKKETLAVLGELRERLGPQSSFGHNLANHIAQTLYHTVPVIYTAVPYFYPIPVRWRNQFNENSKVMAFSNVFPELNHNEIMGWEGPRQVNQHFRVILLRDREESSQNKKRVEITKQILKNKKIPVLEVFSEGKSRLARMFSLIYTGDWASYYLAMINEKDPITIDSIDFLKKKLKEK